MSIHTTAPSKYSPVFLNIALAASPLHLLARRYRLRRLLGRIGCGTCPYVYY